MKKSILLMVALCSVSLMAEPVRLGGLGPDTMIETRGVTAQGVTNIVDAALASIDAIVEADPVAYPVATNALALAEGALQAEADTLGTVTARGATTARAVTIGSRGAGAVGVSSFANGANVVANGYTSHAEGGRATASGHYSHAEGEGTRASGNYSHAEGEGTTASGNYSHAEGEGTTASGDASHASGFNSVASNTTAFAWQGAASEQFAEPEYGSHGPGTFNINPVGGLAGLWIGETNMAATLSGYATTGAVAAVQAEVADPWIDWSAIIMPVNGTATVTRATGAEPMLTLADDVVISVPTDSWPTTGVARVSLSLWAGTHSVTLLTNTVEYSSMPTISTNDWTTILFRRTGDQAKWKGVGL